MANPTEQEIDGLILLIDISSANSLGLHVFGLTGKHKQTPLAALKAYKGCEVDVSGLKQPLNHGLKADYSKGFMQGWNDCIDHLSQRYTFIEEEKTDGK